MSAVPASAPAASLANRIAALDWRAIEGDLDAQGSCVIPLLLAPDECNALIDGYEAPDLYRKRVVMAQHGYGRGEYRYFNYPLPTLVGQLRAAVYPHLVPIANRWNQALHVAGEYPPEHVRFIERCHAAGQLRPTSLLLRYGSGDYNCLHQDLYGEIAFPLQLAVLLSQPGRDFSGGEFVLVEQRPRMQSRPEVVPLGQGDAVIFAVHQRPVQGARGMHRVNLRHGVSRVRSGQRLTLGVIFHDAT